MSLLRQYIQLVEAQTKLWMNSDNGVITHNWTMEQLKQGIQHWQEIAKNQPNMKNAAENNVRLLTRALKELEQNGGVNPLAGQPKPVDGSNSPIKTARPTTNAPAPSPEQAPEAEPTAEPTPPTQNVKPSGRKDPQVQALQQALVDAGFELPKYGVDGIMGSETQGAIKAAELALGRKPTGNVLPQEIARIGQSIQNSDLVKALSTIEAILAKYKIQIKEDIDIILENINMFTPAEQMQIWAVLSEWDISGDAAYADMQKDMDARAAKERIKSAYQDSQQAARNYNQGVSASAAPKATWMQKLMQKLGPKLAGKLGTRAAAAGASSWVPVVGQAIGVGLAAWTAYDVAKELYDFFTKTDIEDLEDADQEAVKQALPVIMKYNKDPKAMAAIPDDLKTRVANAMKGLERLSAT